MVSKKVAPRRFPTLGARSLRAVLLAVVLALGALTLTGCDFLQKDLTCPGERCTKELAALRDQIAALPDVTGVTSVEYHYGLDPGTSGVIVYRANPKGAAAAKQLNHQVIDLYRHSAVDSENRAATRLTARMVWDPERYVSHTMDAGAFRIGTATSGPAAGEDCAATRCAAQIRAVSRRLEAGLPSPNVTLKEVTFREDATTGQPVIEVRLASDLRGDRPTPITQATDRTEKLLESSGISTSYGERVLVTHPVQHSMVTDWDSADNSYNDLADRYL